MVNVLSIVSYRFLPAKLGGHKGIALFHEYFGKYVNDSISSVEANSEQYARNYTLLKTFGNSPCRYINPFYLLPLIKIIRQRKIYYLLLEHPYMGWLAVLLKVSCKIKLIVKSHNIEASRFKTIGKWWWAILWHYEKWVYKKADKIFFIADEDRKFAVAHYKLNMAKCHVITYGTERSAPPSVHEKQEAKKKIQIKHGLTNEVIFLFNGTLNYAPNLDAVNAIINSINPQFLKNAKFPYKIIICGKDLPPALNDLKDYADKNILYAGFVEDIDVYFAAADCFLNPVVEGGGIKTKVVEALAFNLDVITTKSGAAGIPIAITNNKMKVVDDQNLHLFFDTYGQITPNNNIGTVFFDFFNWENIAQKAANLLPYEELEGID